MPVCTLSQTSSVPHLQTGPLCHGTDRLIHWHLLLFWFWFWLFQLSSLVRPTSKLRHRRLSGSIVLFQMMCFLPLMLQPVMKILTAIMFCVLAMEAITLMSIRDTVASKHTHALGNGDRCKKGTQIPHINKLFYSLTVWF